MKHAVAAVLAVVTFAVLVQVSDSRPLIVAAFVGIYSICAALDGCCQRMISPSRPMDQYGHDKLMQSPVTYRRELRTPRFVPLQDRDHGAWTIQ